MTAVGNNEALAYSSYALPRFPIYRNLHSYINDHFMILSFDYNWYSVRRFVFSHVGISLDNGIRIGNNYNEIKDLYIPLGEYEDPVNQDYRMLYYGEEYYKGYPGYGFSKMVLVFDKNNTLIEIQISIVYINITENMNDILVNEWKTYPAHYPQWKFQFINGGLFSFYYKINSNEDYTEERGMWEIIYRDNIPYLELLFDAATRLNGVYDFYKINENRYCFPFSNNYFFYPYIDD